MELTLKNEHCAVTVTDAGAMLRSLVRDGREYLWQGDPAYWAGQAPVCFPIVGVLPKGASTAFGKPCRMKRHGVARINPFTLTEHHRNGATFTQVANDNTLAAYPFDYRLEIRYELVGSTVAVTYHIINSGGEPMPFVIGGHPAFNCPLAAGERFEDYQVRFDRPVTKAPLRPDHQTGIVDPARRYGVLTAGQELPLRHDLFYDDALIFDQVEAKAATLLGPKGYGVRVEYQDMANLLVWSAENDAPFVALEPWSGISHCTDEDGTLEHRRGVTVLQPGETATFGYKITMLSGEME